MILVPIGLAALDLTMIVSASQINEHLAEDAARAAANEISIEDAKAAAQTAIKSAAINPPIIEVQITDFKYDPTLLQVQVVTSLTTGLPVPFASLQTVTLRADAVEPIVAIPAPP
jgi:hypothetical protein